MSKKSSIKIEIDESPIDWTTSYERRIEEWYDKRNAILETNLEIGDDATATIVTALKDCAEELKQKTQGFSLKASSLTPYHGERVADKADTWIEGAERVLLTCAYETNTSNSTERWALYEVPYLKGAAFQWAQLRWPLQKVLGATTTSYEVDWEEFRKGFLLQYVHADAVAVLRKRFDPKYLSALQSNFVFACAIFSEGI